MSSPYSQEKESEMEYFGINSKMTEWPHFVSKANHLTSVIQVYVPSTDAKEVEVD